MEETEKSLTSTSAALRALAELEAAADDVLVDEGQLVELDKKRQENLMAERKLKAMYTSGKTSDEKTWMAFGHTFIKIPTKTAHYFLESNQKVIEKEINSLHDGLKEKVNRLRELEGGAPR